MSETDDNPAAPKAEAMTETMAPPFSDGFPELDTADARQRAGQPDGAARSGAGRNIEAMLHVDLRVQVILGHARMPISQLLKLSRGSVIELDRRIGEPVDVVINDRLVARGDLVKLEGDRIGVTLTEIVKDYVSDS